MDRTTGRMGWHRTDWWRFPRPVWPLPIVRFDVPLSWAPSESDISNLCKQLCRRHEEQVLPAQWHAAVAINPTSNMTVQ
jgi:hypothetical protein